MGPLLVFFFISLSCLSVNGRLSYNYYEKSCPKVEEIVRDVMVEKQILQPATAGATVRLFFHDCFVDGCDASVLLSSTPTNKAERDADINLSLPGDGFDAVVRAKTQLEFSCPGIVSCADILALAARDLITITGGPYYKVRLGRKDGRVSEASRTASNLPLPTMSVSEQASVFAAKGFSIGEMVALIGAHTIGFSHCKEFAKRLYSFSRSAPVDPSMNTVLSQALRKVCANYTKDPTMSVFNDVMTPGKFDNMYYQNLEKGLGLLASDQILYSDPRTKVFVELFARNQTAFFNAFVHAMEKLGTVGVKVGRKGEVRDRCDMIN